MGQRTGDQAALSVWVVLGAVLIALSPALADPVLAASRRHAGASHIQHASLQSRHDGAYGRTHTASSAGSRKYTLKGGKARYASAAPRLQCVPFARAASGIELKGNAANWWEAASGVYERGSRPEPGSVLNFRSTGHMRLGHVAVVTAVSGSREIEIEHANWAGPGANKGRVSRNIPVIDVSDNNDWSAVRVGLGRSGDYGSVYPTYGFIYDRADRGVMVANAGAAASPTVLAIDEVAEATPRLPRTRWIGHGPGGRTLLREVP